MTVNQVLAATAVGLALLAPLADPGFRTRRTDPARVDAVTLAEWLRDRRPVTIVDLRDSTSYEEFHLPEAVSASQAVSGGAARGTIVLYDGGDGSARRARRAYARGDAAVLFMEDAIGDWLREIMNPVFPADASPAERAAFDRQAEVSRYFGGVPRIGALTDARGARELLDQTRRRGCAF